MQSKGKSGHVIYSSLATESVSLNIYMANYTFVMFLLNKIIVLLYKYRKREMDR